MNMRFKLENDVEFSPSERCLIGADGTVLELTENSLRFLILLLNGVTEKEKLIHQVWKEQSGAISESSYYGQLYALRKAFSQVGLRETLIRTIPRKGAQYVGKVTKIATEKPDSMPEKALHSSAQPEPVQYIAPLGGLDNTLVTALEKRESERQAKAANLFADRRWSFLVSILAVVAVCWLSTLSVLIIYILLKSYL
ncbi:winged helix-turn-helix domain-containing protein [Budvicia diplopodorum]|uniref:winged helix-turn-helix domain-containing protein n=1 Tax=Budvicia diplopodorum TaxID=1119056 RepID=UPI00135AC194|nr:hypothetical protein [Budvicia diplopodorum]